MSRRTIIKRSTIPLPLVTFPLFTLLGACSSDMVDLGGGTVTQDLKLGTRCAESQVVDESVTITNQSELDALLGCEEIRGDLTVQVFDGTDVSPLSSLRAVGGTLVLGAFTDIDLGAPDLDAEFLAYGERNALRTQLIEAGWLTSLHGVEALESAGSLALQGIAAPNLEAFGRLRTLGGHYDGTQAGSISVDGTTNLLDLQGLGSVKGLRSIYVENNVALEGLDGLNVGAALDNVLVMYNAKLTDLSALSSLERIDGTLYLFGLGIENLDAFENLGGATDGIGIDGNPELTDAAGLSTLVSTEYIVFQNNAKLASVPEFPNLALLSSFKVLGNAELQSVSLNFTSLYNFNLVNDVTIPISADVIEIGNNPKLESIALISGFEATQVLEVYQNPSLASIDLGSMQRLDRLVINDNASLTEVQLGALQTVDFLSVFSNPLLSTAELANVRTFSSEFGGNAGDPPL